jgi:hypothetical protein
MGKPGKFWIDVLFQMAGGSATILFFPFLSRAT